jgi:hypothetical protein
MMDETNEEKVAKVPECPKWEYRKEMRINQEMRKVVQATIKVSQAQIDLLRRKVEKLQYGS